MTLINQNTERKNIKVSIEDFKRMIDNSSDDLELPYDAIISLYVK